MRPPVSSGWKLTSVFSPHSPRDLDESQRIQFTLYARNEPFRCCALASIFSRHLQPTHLSNSSIWYGPLVGRETN